MHSLKLFGGACLAGEDGPVTGPAGQRHRVALLALLAAAQPGGLSRDKLVSYLWPERDTEHARNLLRQAVHALRRTVGEEAILSSGDELRLNTALLQVDLAEFEAALGSADEARAVSLYHGPFLDGFHLRDATDFEHWTERERVRLSAAYAKALETLAEAATGEGDFRRAAEWWKARAVHDQYDSRVALCLMQALVASGNRAGALQHAAIHERLLEEEFGMKPPPELSALAEQLRREPADAWAGREPVAARIPNHSSAAGESRARTEAITPVARSFARLFARRPAVPAFVALVLTAMLSTGWLLSQTTVRETAAPTPGATITRTIAVLPFANLSRAPGEDYFSDGLTEELIGVLSQVRALRVAARTSAFAFKGESRDIREIGRALDVGAVLEGSVRRDGNRVRVSAQLINVADGFNLWSQTYERELTDIFGIQSDLAVRIARALEAELTPAERERLARRPTNDPDAYALYLKGRHFWNQRTTGGFARAIEYFERAVEADPRYAAAHAGLATAYSLQGLSGDLAPDEARQRMGDAARRAVALDDGLAEAHAALGAYLNAYEWDSDAAEREYLRAIELDPSYPTARHFYGNLLTQIGRLEEAVAQKRKAVELDPLDPTLSGSLSHTLLRSGRADEARALLLNALELDSTFWRTHESLGAMYEAAGRLDDAAGAYERAIELAGARPLPRARYARVLALTGRKDAARRILDDLEADAARTGIHAPLVATVHLALDDTEAALTWLEQSYRERHPQLRFINTDQEFSRLADDPRLLDLLSRVGLKQ